MPVKQRKDTAQIYIPSLALFHGHAQSLDSPVFHAAGGYICIVTVKSQPGENIAASLRFYPDMCREETAPFPFSRPFTVMIVNPDDQVVCTQDLVDWHITSPERPDDRNINPP